SSLASPDPHWLFFRRSHPLHVRPPRPFSSASCFLPTATAGLYTLSLHDALPISSGSAGMSGDCWSGGAARQPGSARPRRRGAPRSEEHTSELQSREKLVCRLLLEKKKAVTNGVATTGEEHAPNNKGCEQVDGQGC